MAALKGKQRIIDKFMTFNFTSLFNLYSFLLILISFNYSDDSQKTIIGISNDRM